MKRLFSGGSTKTEPDLYSSPATTSPPAYSGSKMQGPPQVLSDEPLSGELVPIVTLLTAHTHRRYHEGVLMVLHDLKSDGTPAARTWQEVYGVLIGTQIAFWDTREIAGTPDADFRKFASKPSYLNLADATLRPVDGLSGPSVTTASSKKPLKHALAVSTTLKNRYFLQFGDAATYARWQAAVRLSLFENVALQEAYTGAFLSSRGARLGDIQVILGSTKHEYAEWVGVRFGAGMPWRRCFAVVSPSGKSKSKGKGKGGKVSFYESEKHAKKSKGAMATITAASEVYAVYPSSPRLIDSSTIIKVEGAVVTEGEDAAAMGASDIFIMPEKHNAVQGYDTIIRFLVPAMNAFELYGRPKRLIASKDDPRSLLFALPTLPHLYYLEPRDLLPLAQSGASAEWSSADWKARVSDLLVEKLRSGYSGCGTSADLRGNAASSNAVESGELFESAGPILSGAKAQAQAQKQTKNETRVESRGSREPPRKREQIARTGEAPPRSTEGQPPRSHSTSPLKVAKRGEKTRLAAEAPVPAQTPPYARSPNKTGADSAGALATGAAPPGSQASLSSIFNMYGGAGDDAGEVPVLPPLPANSKGRSSPHSGDRPPAADPYNAFVQMGGSPRRTQGEEGRGASPGKRVASEIQNLGRGIQDISLGPRPAIGRFDSAGTAASSASTSGMSTSGISAYTDADPFDPEAMEEERMMEEDNAMSARSIGSGRSGRGAMPYGSVESLPREQVATPPTKPK